MILRYVLFAICGFISGSVMYSYLIAKHFYNVDITVEGSDMFWSLCVILIIFSAIIIIRPHSLRMIVSMIWQIVWCIVKRESAGLMFGGIFSSVIVIIKHIMNKDKEKTQVKLPFMKFK